MRDAITNVVRVAGPTNEVWLGKKSFRTVLGSG
jgi:hypothetical protein